MNTQRWAAAALVLAAWQTSPAFAQEGAQASEGSVVAEVASNPFGNGAALDEADLGKVTGREDTALLIARSTQQNTVANNSVTGNSVTGAVQIDGNAFQNISGLAVISANSGNNVAINSAMNVTINMAPPR